MNYRANREDYDPESYPYWLRGAPEPDSRQPESEDDYVVGLTTEFSDAFNVIRGLPSTLSGLDDTSYTAMGGNKNKSKTTAATTVTTTSPITTTASATTATATTTATTVTTTAKVTSAQTTVCQPMPPPVCAPVVTATAPSVTAAAGGFTTTVTRAVTTTVSAFAGFPTPSFGDGARPKGFMGTGLTPAPQQQWFEQGSYFDDTPGRFGMGQRFTADPNLGQYLSDNQRLKNDVEQWQHRHRDLEERIRNERQEREYERREIEERLRNERHERELEMREMNELKAMMREQSARLRELEMQRFRETVRDTGAPALKVGLPESDMLASATKRGANLDVITDRPGGTLRVAVSPPETRRQGAFDWLGDRPSQPINKAAQQTSEQPAPTPQTTQQPAVLAPTSTQVTRASTPNQLMVRPPAAGAAYQGMRQPLTSTQSDTDARFARNPPSCE